MSRDFISSEVGKIIKDKELEFPRNMAMASAWILGNFKGINLKIFNVKSSSSLSDFYIVASATNTTQATSMADEVTFQLKQHGLTTRSKEGISGSDWILLDLGDIIIHIFQESSREIYALEELWKGAESVTIPQSYYFSSEDTEAAEKISDEKGRDFF